MRSVRYPYCRRTYLCRRRLTHTPGVYITANEVQPAPRRRLRSHLHAPCRKFTANEIEEYLYEYSYEYQRRDTVAV